MALVSLQPACNSWWSAPVACITFACLIGDKARLQANLAGWLAGSLAALAWLIGTLIRGKLRDVGLRATILRHSPLETPCVCVCECIADNLLTFEYAVYNIVGMNTLMHSCATRVQLTQSHNSQFTKWCKKL